MNFDYLINTNVRSTSELKLGLVQSQMAQKLMLRGELGARALRVRSAPHSKPRKLGRWQVRCALFSCGDWSSRLSRLGASQLARRAVSRLVATGVRRWAPGSVGRPTRIIARRAPPRSKLYCTGSLMAKAPAARGFQPKNGEIFNKEGSGPAIFNGFGTTRTAQSPTLFVTNLPHGVTTGMLEAIFAPDPGFQQLRTVLIAPGVGETEGCGFPVANLPKT